MKVLNVLQVFLFLFYIMDYFSFCLVELDLAAFLPFFKLLMFMLVALSVDVDVSFEIICLLICLDKLHLVIVYPFIAPELSQKSRFVIGFVVDAGRKGQLLAAHTYSYRGEWGNIRACSSPPHIRLSNRRILISIIIIIIRVIIIDPESHFMPLLFDD